MIMLYKRYAELDYKKSGPGFFYPMLAVITVLFLAISAAVIRIMPFMEEMAVSKLQGSLTVIINSEILKTAAAGGMDFGEIYQKNDAEFKNGDVITLNMSEVNRIKAELSEKLQKRLDKEEQISVRVPIGGIFSTAKGMRVNIRLLGINSLKTDIEDEFNSEGYNHTRHYIYVKTETEAAVLLFGKIRKINIETKVPLFEGIIIGEPPSLVAGK